MFIDTKYNESELKDKILKISSAFVDLKKARLFLFGSRVTGSGLRDGSDLDIGIQSECRLNLGITENIKEALSALPYPYKFDVVDFDLTDDNFREVAMKKVEYLN